MIVYTLPETIKSVERVRETLSYVSVPLMIFVYAAEIELTYVKLSNPVARRKYVEILSVNTMHLLGGRLHRVASLVQQKQENC